MTPNSKKTIKNIGFVEKILSIPSPIRTPAMIEDINEYDPELYEELVDNVTNETFIDVNNNGGQF